MADDLTSKRPVSSRVKKIASHSEVHYFFFVKLFIIVEFL
jgi:hypothetical protein